MTGLRRRAGRTWLDEHVREQKGTILAETAAKALVRDSGRIVGVKAEQGGREIYVHALRGVILAGSSFTNNRAMIKKYCPRVYERAVGTFLPPIDTGEVVRMGLRAGADLAGQDSWTCFAGGIPFHDTSYTGKREPGPWFQYLRQGYLQVVRNAGWLEMNANCEEFLPEGAKMDYEQHPKTITGQPGHRAKREVPCQADRRVRPASSQYEAHRQGSLLRSGNRRASGGNLLWSQG
jgi:succinate dehydrogenase/fumarate reductase flavoprotein subunit